MKKLLITILLLLITGCSQPINLGAENKIKKEHKLKAPKEKILDSKIVDWIEIVKDEKGNPTGEIENKGKIKKYRYVSDVKVLKKKIEIAGVEVEEEISKRTYNTMFFKKPKLLGGVNDNKNIYIVRMYTGSPFYEESGEWFQTEEATTTIAIFNESLPERAEMLGATDYPTGTGDGVCYNYEVTLDWDSVHDDSASSAASYTTTGNNLGNASRFENAKTSITRSFLPVDTSAIDDDATISSAIYKLYVYGAVNQSGEANSYVVAATTTQASTNQVVVGDFDQIGTTAGSDTFDIDDLTTDKYNDFALNATGIGWVDKTGVTKIGFREGHDILDSAPVDTNAYNYVNIRFSNHTGTDQDPYLEVEIETARRRFITIE